MKDFNAQKKIHILNSCKCIYSVSKYVYIESAQIKADMWCITWTTNTMKKKYTNLFCREFKVIQTKLEVSAVSEWDEKSCKTHKHTANFYFKTRKRFFQSLLSMWKINPDPKHVVWKVNENCSLGEN